MRKKATQLMLACGLILLVGCANDKSNIQSVKQDAARARISAELPGDTGYDPNAPKILPQTHFAAGQLFEAQGYFHKAIVQYQKAISTDHQFVDAYHRIALLYSRMGRYHEATEALAKAIQFRPDNASLQNNLGFVYALQEDWGKAEEYFRNALELDSGFARANVNLGMTLGHQGRFDEALLCFKRVLPEEDAYYNLGLMYVAQNRYTDAAAAFQRVLNMSPQFTAARSQLESIQPQLALAARREQDKMRNEEGTASRLAETDGMFGQEDVASVDDAPARRAKPMNSSITPYTRRMQVARLQKGPQVRSGRTALLTFRGAKQGKQAYTNSRSISRQRMVNSQAMLSPANQATQQAHNMPSPFGATSGYAVAAQTSIELLQDDSDPCWREEEALAFGYNTNDMVDGGATMAATILPENQASQNQDKACPASLFTLSRRMNQQTASATKATKAHAYLQRIRDMRVGLRGIRQDIHELNQRAEQLERRNRFRVRQVDVQTIWPEMSSYDPSDMSAWMQSNDWTSPAKTQDQASQSSNSPSSADQMHSADGINEDNFWSFTTSWDQMKDDD